MASWFWYRIHFPIIDHIFIFCRRWCCRWSGRWWRQWYFWRWHAHYICIERDKWIEFSVLFSILSFIPYVLCQLTLFHRLTTVQSFFVLFCLLMLCVQRFSPMRQNLFYSSLRRNSIASIQWDAVESLLFLHEFYQKTPRFKMRHTILPSH